MTAGLRDLGREWAEAAARPRVPSGIKAEWDHLLAEWVESDLPLIIRKGGGIRGAVLTHSSGRELLVSDNSPAQWAFCEAYGGRTPTVDGIRGLLAKDAIPFAFATKSADKAFVKYRRTLSAKDSVNKCGWKLCHMSEIGLSTRTPPSEILLADLVRHFTLLMAPSNHFLVPLAWSGLGEVHEFITEIKQHDARSGG